MREGQGAITLQCNLLAAGFRSIRQLEDNRHLTVLDYVRRAANEARLVADRPTPSRQVFHQTFAKHCQAYFKNNPARAEKAAAQMRRAPMMQLADHGDLLLDRQTFMNNYLYQMAGREANYDFLFTQQCTRVHCMMDKHGPQGPIGPAYVHRDMDVFQIFNKSNNALARSSVATLQDVPVMWQPLGILTSPSASAPTPEVIKPFIGAVFPRAATAINTMNQHIWRSFSCKAKKELVLFDEDFTCDLVADYLKDGNNSLARLVTGPDTRRAFLEVRQEYRVAHPHSMIDTGTELFWMNGGQSLRAATFSADGKSLGANGAEISTDRESLIEALRTRRIYPDLSLSYLALSILPNIPAFGGASQHEYVPAIRDVACMADARIPFLDPAERGTLPHSNTSVLLSSMIMELPMPAKRALGMLDKDTKLDQLESEFAAKNMGDLSGDFSRFAYMLRVRDQNVSRPPAAAGVRPT